MLQGCTVNLRGQATRCYEARHSASVTQRTNLLESERGQMKTPPVAQRGLGGATELSCRWPRVVAVVSDAGERHTGQAHDVAGGFQILVAVIISALVFAVNGLLARLGLRVLLQISSKHTLNIKVLKSGKARASLRAFHGRRRN
jgi:hypothetical protein